MHLLGAGVASQNLHTGTKEHMDPDEFDQNLYHVAIDHEHQFTVDNFSTIRDFDPVSFSDNLDNVLNKDDIYEWL